MQENYAELQTAAKKISGSSHLWEELLHYALDEFLRKPEVETIISSGGGRFYIVRIMMTQWKSVTSPFFNTYRKPTDSLSEEHEDIPAEEEDERILTLASQIKVQLDELPWYDKMLFDTFVNENHTVSSLARATGIPRTSISLSINRIRRHIKNSL